MGRSILGARARREACSEGTRRPQGFTQGDHKFRLTASLSPPSSLSTTPSLDFYNSYTQTRYSLRDRLSAKPPATRSRQLDATTTVTADLSHPHQLETFLPVSVISNAGHSWVVDIALVPVETELYDLLGVHPAASEGTPLCSTLASLAIQRLVLLSDEIKKAYKKMVGGLTSSLTYLNSSR